MNGTNPIPSDASPLPRVGLGLMREPDDKLWMVLVNLLLGGTLGLAVAVSAQPPPVLLAGDDVPERYVDMMMDTVDPLRDEEEGEPEPPMYCGSAPMYDGEGNVVGHYDGYYDPRCSNHPEVLSDRNDQLLLTNQVFRLLGLLECFDGNAHAAVAEFSRLQAGLPTRFSGDALFPCSPPMQFGIGEIEVLPVETGRVDLPAEDTRDQRSSVELVTIDVLNANPSAIRGVVDRYSGQIRACYEQRLKEAPHLKGRIELLWSIEQGRTRGVQLIWNSTGDSTLASCMASKVSFWRFPSDLGEDVEVVAAFMLEPPP